ncbi:DUF1493 family protein [Pinibacter aurantiacus]|uniref:DUF1493 family protein n=1 Tax=Pinibacter aurantiacus TaxID=2851599 RepID=A0A9E2SBT7_9BACT|nr:DUF1493 family protein [Pinibacter aurantiacus]MBV4360173.1 DUF1493 family protein [Pinibacter aurantiacus]
MTEPYTLDEIVNLIAEKSGCDVSEIKPDSDISNDLGCWGDDFDELMSEYCAKFKVDMSSYLWYFHTEEEGYENSIGRAFFKAPYEQVEHIPVTPRVMLESANSGKWSLTYPPHTLPKRRYDGLINLVVILLFIAFGVYTCIKR